MILVTGAKGQMGQSLKKVFPADKVIYTDIEELDITVYDSVDKIVRENNISTIINAAGYTAVDSAEKNMDQAYAVNAFGARNLAMAAAKYNLGMIQMSTDFIFDGNNFKPYTENDKPHPLSVYGQTKLEGELFVLKNAPQCIVLRTSWLYSEYGRNFLKTMLNLTAARPHLDVVFDQTGTPTYAGDLAEAVFDIVEHRKYENKDGIYHYSNEGVCSWYDFAEMIAEYSGHTSCDIRPCHSNEFPSPVKRPSYSVLDKTRIKQAFGLRIPYWTDSLKKCIDNINNAESHGL